MKTTRQASSPRSFHADGKQSRKKQPKESVEHRKHFISVYADGSSSGRSAEPGGFGWVILLDGQPVSAGYGGNTSTTNNRMELQGAISGLEHLYASGLYKSANAIELVSDSQYVLGVAAGQYHTAKNVDLADCLKVLCSKLGVNFRWVKGHSKDPWNDRCDSLAKQGKREAQGTLMQGSDCESTEEAA